MLTAETVRKLLDYEPETGVFRWRVDVNSRARKGMVAGCGNGEGYTRIKVFGNSYRAHRLVWLHVYGDWPPEQIDHVNGLRDDNRLVNLRLATNSQNSANKPAQRNNALGLKGVCFRSDSGKFESKIMFNSQQKHLGRFQTAEEAHAAYCAAAEKFFGEFARFE